MSSKIQSRNKKLGINSPSHETKRVPDPAIAAAYTYLGERLGEIFGKAVDATRRAEMEKDLGDLVAESVQFNAPSSIINVLDGVGRGYNKAKRGAD